MNGVRVGSTPTPFIANREKQARAYGPFQFECGAFGQRYDDCAYLALNHNELYESVEELWPELRSFIRTSRFSTSISRTPPDGDLPVAARSRLLPPEQRAARTEP